MKGHVVGHQPRIDVVFRIPNQPDLTIEFAVDTGFEGCLTLPPAAISALKLSKVRSMSTTLADDSMRFVDVFEAVIVWHGMEVVVDVLPMGLRPLLGTTLLTGSYFGVDFVPGGDVVIKPHP